jgi:hypothetical protein
MQISRIRLSDKTSRFRPRLVAASRCQAHEPEVPVKVTKGLGRRIPKRAKNGVHTGLIARTLRLEPLEYVLIKPQRHKSL